MNIYICVLGGDQRMILEGICERLGEWTPEMLEQWLHSALKEAHGDAEQDMVREKDKQIIGLSDALAEVKTMKKEGRETQDIIDFVNRQLDEYANHG